MTQPQQGTKVLVYTPDVNAYIMTQGGIIDVSADISKGQIRRVENSVSQASLVLNNIRKQYTGVIKRMDRIVIFLTRIQKLQVFAGYVDSAPFLDLYPTTCTVTASCTLKRLLYTYWDPGLTTSEQILNQQLGGSAAPSGASMSTDSGLGSMLANLLVKVGGWDKNAIKIQNFPPNFLSFAANTNTDPQAYANAVAEMQRILGFNLGATNTPGTTGTPGAPGPGGAPAPPSGPPLNGNLPTAAGTYGGQSLSAQQLANANIIAAVGRSMNIPQQGIAIALMTAMHESSLQNLTTAVDHDSLGLFQQRPSAGWGSPAQLTNPTFASTAFYSALMGVPNWQSLSPSAAAQAVQRSAFPDAYAKWAPMANALIAGAGGAPTPPPPPAPPPPAGTPGAPAPGTAAAGGSGATAGGASVPPYAYGLFNVMFNEAAFYSGISQELTGERALINDQQLMSMIQSVAKAGLRSFQSSPDGQFVAYYPDYFGIAHNATTFKLEDIEMKNVSIQISDAPLATHVYTVGDSETGFGTLMTTAPDQAWMTTQGIMTIEHQDIFKMMLNIDPANAQDFTPEAIYKRFGARPLVMSLPQIRNVLLEKFQALHMFMQKWAEQYSTKVATTFLPEVFPGMRVELSGHQLTVYVSEVTHTFDRKLGFSTEMTIMAPSTTAGGLPGLPLSRTGAPGGTGG